MSSKPLPPIRAAARAAAERRAVSELLARGAAFVLLRRVVCGACLGERSLVDGLTEKELPSMPGLCSCGGWYFEAPSEVWS